MVSSQRMCVCVFSPSLAWLSPDQRLILLDNGVTTVCDNSVAAGCDNSVTTVLNECFIVATTILNNSVWRFTLRLSVTADKRVCACMCACDDDVCVCVRVCALCYCA
jgi:hypothetical protein